ncbi:MAG: ABC-F family ATP-binding cassette domain-containing protein [Opitutales bacterium]|nr:ABC-F family ATP-binding cassette domain-containing protein [Opitutales bacterium]
MIALDHISLSYGKQVLYNEITALIGSKDRIGLVGANGSGKSTLLKILVGLQEVDSGSIEKASYVTLGYLAQDGGVDSDKCLYAEVETAFEDILTVRKRYDDAQHSLGQLEVSDPLYEDALSLLGELQHRLEELEAHKLKSKIETVLLGLGFSMSDMERSCREFSGGWQMRIALAKLLLREPSLLLLDEPTNHLDLDSLRWLEQYLRQYDGAILLVSHDRAFLDALTTRVFALTHGRLDTYTGNYSYFEVESARRKEQQEKAYLLQQKQIEKTEQFIERFRYKASKAKQVQSRIKALDKVERLEIEDKEGSIGFKFPAPQRSGHSIIKLESVCKSYGQLHVLRNIDLEIVRGDRVAIVGVNGAGKSTLTRILSRSEAYDSGSYTLGHNVEVSFFAQHQADELDPEKSVYDIAYDAALPEMRPRLRSLLGSFLFKGDAVFKKAKVLSGGERNRLALAKMLLRPGNCLILDEPTNHLDMQSKDMLKRALAAYEGTFIIVSHDRDFLDSIVDKVLEVSRSGIRTFLGNITDYVAKIDAERAAVAPSASGVSRTVAAAAPVDQLNPRLRRQMEAEKRQRLAPLRRKLEDLETRIASTETAIADYEVRMVDPDFFKRGAETTEQIRDYEDKKHSLETLMADWEALTEEIESLQD